MFPSLLIFNALLVSLLVLFLAIKGCRNSENHATEKRENGKKKEKKTKSKNTKNNVKKIQVKPKQEQFTKKGETGKSKISNKKK